jgi:hypothetical protein
MEIKDEAEATRYAHAGGLHDSGAAIAKRKQGLEIVINRCDLAGSAGDRKFVLRISMYPRTQRLRVLRQPYTHCPYTRYRCHCFCIGPATR